MDERSIAGLFATLVVVALAVVGLYGFGTSYLIESPGRYLAPTVGALAVAVLVVGTLTVVGGRSKRWLENPYW